MTEPKSVNLTLLPKRFDYNAKDKLFDRNPEHLEEKQSAGGIPTARHHIIPCNRLILFWNAAIEHYYNNEKGPIREVLNDLVGDLKRNLDNKYRDYLTLGPYEYIEDFVRNFIAPKNKYKNIGKGGKGGQWPPGFEDLMAIYEWLPPNLFIGPRGDYRCDDPTKDAKGDGFEYGCRPIIYKDRLILSKNVNFHMNKFISMAKDERDRTAYPLIEATAVRNFLSQIMEFSSTPYSLREPHWQESQKKYRLRESLCNKPAGGVGYSTEEGAQEIPDFITIGDVKLHIEVLSQEYGYYRAWGQADNIEMGSFIKWIRDNWGDPPLPETIEGCVLHNLTLDISTGPEMNYWNFSAVVTMDFGDVPVIWVVEMSHSRVADKPRASAFGLSGSAGLTVTIDGQKDRMWFSGAITQQQGTWSFTATWEAMDKGISLADLAAALGIQELDPEILKTIPEIQKASIAYQMSDQALAVTISTENVEVAILSVAGSSQVGD